MSIKWIKSNWILAVISLVALFIISIFGYGIYRSAIQPKEGYVIRKDYYPEYTFIDYNYITQSNGERIMVPAQKYHAARYVITIKGVNSKGEEDKGVYDVTPVEYESIEIGDYYIRQKGGVRE